MKRKVIHLSYFFKNKEKANLKLESSYCKRLYFSNSFIINLYSYRHLYYALNLADIKKEKIILDIGCADGPFLPTLNKNYKRIIGLDLSFKMLLNAKGLVNYDAYPLNNVLLINADGQYLPFKDKHIDLIYCLEIFEHMITPTNLMNEIYRILKDDGELIFSVPIEIGISLLFRHLLGKITNFPRESHSLKELFRNAILKKPSNRGKPPFYHKNFDWRIIQRLISKKFITLKIIYSPFSFLKSLNPTIIFKMRKKIQA